MTLPKAGVLLLGGGENGVSVARNLSALGIHVSASGEHGAWVLNSRYCDKRYPVPKGIDASSFWNDLLRSDSELEGSVIFPLCDDSITFVCQNKDWLEERYILEDFDPELRLAMLDKKETLEIARAAGVPTPNFWTVNSVEDLDAIRDEITFPVMVKPIHSHLFTKVFGCKLFIIKSDFEEARHKIALAQSHGLNVMLVEMIPGPDSLLSSYYTYIDQHGERLFDYTKCVIRRYPINRGGTCHHKSVILPETAEMGRKFFGYMPWRGTANIEFKRDERDGQLKVIECNPRFTGGHALVTASGMKIDEFIYAHLTGQEKFEMSQSSEDIRLWNPLRDMFASIELYRRGELSVREWLASVRSGRKIYPMWSVKDPRPELARLRYVSGRVMARKLSRSDG